MIWVVYFTLFFLVLYVYRRTKTDAIYRYFLPGFVVKVFGGLAFALIYIFYYKFGDTFLYFRGANVLADTFLESPGDYFRLLFSDNTNLPKDLSDITSSISYTKGAEEWFMVRVLSPFALLGFKSYFVTTLIMSTLAFIGGWKLFKVSNDFLNNYPKLNFAAVFLFETPLSSSDLTP